MFSGIDGKDILFFIVVFISNVIQSITGFAGTVLAMPFSIMLVGYSTAKPILNVLGIVVSAGVIGLNHKSLNKKEFLKIMGFMLAGMLGGYLITRTFHLNAGLLYKLLGAIVLFFVVLGVFNSYSEKYKKKKEEAHSKTNFWGYLILAVAGIVHGMFICGGPLLVVYASRKLKGRDEFRVTVSAVWVVLNSILLISDIRDGFFNPKLFVLLGICIGLLFVALWVGNIIFRHINKKWFMIITYVLMAISGVSLLIK
jgi:uncharacterized membrane protein YfcA